MYKGTVRLHRKDGERHQQFDFRKEKDKGINYINSAFSKNDQTSY